MLRVLRCGREGWRGGRVKGEALLFGVGGAVVSFLGGGGGAAGVLEPGWAVVRHFSRFGRVSGKRKEGRWDLATSLRVGGL